ncbi:MAG: Mrp/NBP35 family ATP-binding protein [Thermoplasmata archaeon]|nr:Mrp/NBP35 family ATP-binding protein [Thermoplasmata archaeon]
MERKRFDNSRINKNLESIKHKIIVLSGKGGVGKSTVSANLAVSLSNRGYKVGLLDSDFHGPSIPKILGIEDEHPLSSQNGIINPVLAMDNLKVMSIGFLLEDRDTPVIWRGPLKMNVMRQFIGDVNWGALDYLIVDLPPGTGDEPLSVAQLIPNTDGAIVVTTPQDVALVSVRKSINFVKKMNIPIIGIIENMSGFKCPYCGKHIDIFKTGGGEKAARDFGVPFLGKVPIDPEIVESGDSGTPIFIKNPESDSSKAFAKIVENIEKNVIKEV